MTTTPPNKPSSSPTESVEPDALHNAVAPAAPTEPRSYAGAFAKGCGCVVVAIVLAAGVAFVGHGDVESWGSAIVGVLFLVLIMGSSGLSGWWNKNS